MPDNEAQASGTDDSKTARDDGPTKGSNEPGSVDFGKDEHGRPAGGSTARFSTGVDPQDPVDPAGAKARTA